MNIINYADNTDKNFFENALTIINQHKNFYILVPSNISPIVEKGLESYIRYHKNKKKKNKDWKALFRFAWFGFRTPFLWGVINSSEIHGFSVDSWKYNEKHELEIIMVVPSID